MKDIALKQALPRHQAATVLLYNYRQLPAVPPSISRLNWLQSLNLENNSLTQIPVSIGKLTNLQRLALSNNKFQFLPSSILALTKLTELILDSNMFSSVPLVVWKLRSLTLLSLANNAAISKLSGEIANLTNLCKLDIRRLGRDFTTLPAQMGSMTHLQKLQLDAANFTDKYGNRFKSGSVAVQRMLFVLLCQRLRF